MPKFSGLSHLADVAREQLDDVHCYPVRRRGTRRQLLPNQDGIDWLEGKIPGTGVGFIGDTEIVGETLVEEDGIIFTRAEGANQREYSRPMFQLIYDGVFSGSKQVVKPCEACDNFAYSWGCGEHPQIPWNTLHRRWDRPCTDLPSCDCTPCHIEWRDRTEIRRAFLRERDESPRASNLLFDSIREFQEHLAQVQQPVEIRGRIVDTGAGRGFFDETVMERHRRRDQEDRLLLLPDFTRVLEGTWDDGALRISGEREQGVDTVVTIEVEGRARG